MLTLPKHNGRINLAQSHRYACHQLPSVWHRVRLNYSFYIYIYIHNCSCVMCITHCEPKGFQRSKCKIVQCIWHDADRCGCAAEGRLRIAIACHIKWGPIPPLFPGRAKIKATWSVWNSPLVNRPSKQQACCPSKAFVMETFAVILSIAFAGRAIIVLPVADVLPRQG